MLATHLSFREIGLRFFLSRNTVKTQAISVYRKLGASNRSEAVERAHTSRADRARPGVGEPHPQRMMQRRAVESNRRVRVRHGQRRAYAAGKRDRELMAFSGAGPSRRAPFTVMESRLAPPRIREGTVERTAESSTVSGLRRPQTSRSSSPRRATARRVLLAELYRRPGKRPFAWLSIDERDNDPVTFLTYLTLDAQPHRGVRPAGRGGARPAAELALDHPREAPALARGDRAVRPDPRRPPPAHVQRRASRSSAASSTSCRRKAASRSRAGRSLRFRSPGCAGAGGWSRSVSTTFG